MDSRPTVRVPAAAPIEERRKAANKLRALARDVDAGIYFVSDPLISEILNLMRLL